MLYTVTPSRRTCTLACNITQQCIRYLEDVERFELDVGALVTEHVHHHDQILLHAGVRETERQRDRETERNREKQRETERDRIPSHVNRERDKGRKQYKENKPRMEIKPDIAHHDGEIVPVEKNLAEKLQRLPAGDVVVRIEQHVVVPAPQQYTPGRNDSVDVCCLPITL